MFKHYFEGINGIEIYPVILLLVFLSFFTLITISLIKAGKSRYIEASKLPLEMDSDGIHNS